jgi:hypothetical protein
VDCYAASDQFRKTTEVVRSTYGPDVKVICFDMNYDAMPVDGLGKRTLKPLTIRIKNVGKGLEMKEKNVLNIAFGPIILNSDAELLDMMKAKVHSATRRQCALRFLKRFVKFLVTNYLILNTLIYSNISVYTLIYHEQAPEPTICEAGSKYPIQNTSWTC